MAKQLNVNLGFSADTSKAKQAIQELNTMLTKIQTQPGKMFDDTELKKASAAAKDLQGHLQAAVNVDTGKLDLNKFSQSLSKSNQNLQSLYTDLNRIGPEGQAAFLKMAQSINAADNSALNLGTKLKGLGTTLANTARWQLSSSLLHGFMGAVQGALGYAQDLNESLNNIRIVTGQSVEQMDKFAVKANKAARELSTTTTEYTNASLIFYQQGLSDAEVAKRTEVTIKMANAAGQSAQIVSDQLTAVWNNFYDGSKSLEYYADVMTALGAKTASSTDEIAGGLEKFAAIGQTIGLSYEYAASALATITANTRQSEEVVGTALKTIFARVQGLNLGETLDDGTTLNKYSEALQKVGINIFDQAGELKNMDTILDEMGEKWGTLNKAQQTALAQTVAGTRQYTQLVALMDNWDKGDSDSMKANLDTSYGAEGSLQDQADIYAESWEAARDRVSAAAEGIYQSLLDDDFFITVLDGFESFLNGIKNVIEGLGGLKGILLLVGGIFMQHFAKEIPKALTAVAQNFDVITGKAAANKQAMMDQNVNALNEVDVSGTTDSMNAEIQSITRVSEMSAELERQRKNLSDTELRYYENKIQHIKAYGDEAIAIGKENDELKKLIETKEAAIAKKAVRSQNSDLSKLDEEIKKQEELVAAKQKAAQEAEAKRQSYADGAFKAGNTAAGFAVNNGDEANYIAYKTQALELSQKEQEQALAVKAATDEVTEAEAKLAKMKEKRAQAGASKGSEKEIRSQLKDLEKLSIKYQSMQSALGKIQNQAKAWKTQAKEIQGNQKETEKLKKSMVDYLNHLKDLGLGGKKMDQFIQNFKNGKISIEQATTALENWKKNGSLIDTSGMDAFEQEISEIEQKLLKLGVSQDDLDDLALQFESGAISAEQYRQALDRLNQEAGEMPQHVMSASEGFGIFAGKAMQLMSAITSLQNLGSIWKDEDLSTGQKIMQTMSSLIPVLSLATTLTNKKAMADTKAAATAILHAIGLGTETVAQAGETTGVWASVVAWIAKQAAMWPVLVVTLLLVAAIGILVGIFAGLKAIVTAVSDAYNADAIAAENAENAAKSLAESYNEVKQEYEDMISAMEEYQTARDALDDLTKGTEEYKEALKEANRQAMELINQYGLIEGQDYEWQGDELVIKDEALDRVENEKEAEVDQAYAASQMAGARAKEMRAKSDATDLRREIRDDAGVGDGDKWWKGALDVLGGVSLDILSGGMTGGMGTIAAIGSIANREAESKRYDEMINKAIEEGKTNANLFDSREAMAKALNISLDDTELIDALWANRDSLEQLSADMNAADQAEKLAAQNAANELMSDSGYENTEAGRMALEAGGEIYQQIYKDAENKYLTGKKTSEEDFERFAELSGLSELKGFEMGKRRKDGSVEYTYIDEDGKEQEAVATQEEIAAMLATADAAEQLEGAMSKLRDTITQLNNSKDLGDHAFAEFLSTGNLEGATKAEFDNLREDAGITGEKDENGNLIYDQAKVDSILGLTGDAAADLELAKSRGYESAEAYRNAFIESLDIEWEIPKDIAPNIADILSVGAAGKIQSTYEELGAEGGEAFVNALNHITSGADFKGLDLEEQTAMMDEMANIDWSSWDAGEQAIAIAEKYGVVIDGNNEVWKQWINTMRDSSNALPDLKAIAAELNKIKEVTADIDLGSIISEEDYDLLVKYNQALGDYFTILSDGSAQFIGDKLDFQQQVEETGRQQLEEGINHYMDRLSEIQAQQKAGADAVGGEGNLDGYRDSENYVGSDGKNYYSGNNVDTQLDFLESQGYDQEQLDKWRLDLEDGSTTVQVLEDIAAAVNETADAYGALGTEAETIQGLIQTSMNEIALGADSAAERVKMLEEGTINAAAYGQAAIAAINEEKWGDFEAEEVEEYADYLRSAAEASELLSDELADNEEAAEDVALYVKKMNQGIDKLADGFEDWSDVLKKSDKASDEYAKAMTDMKDAMSDLLGTSEEFISNDFIVEHLEDIEKAATGDAEAIDRLKIALSEDILCNILVVDNFADVNADIQALHNQIIGFDADIQVGATLETGDFASAAQGIVDAAGMTVEQAQAYFNSLGYEPEFVMQNETRTAPMYGKRVYTDSPVIDYVETGDGSLYPYIAEMTTHEEQVYMGEQEQNFVVPALSADGTPQIKSITKTSTGSMNNSSKSNSGGKSSGKNGGGGGGGDKTKKTSDERKKKNDIVDPYKEVNDQLERVNHLMSKNDTLAEGLWGAARSAKMRENIALLNQEVALLEDKLAISEEQMNLSRQDLNAAAGVLGVSLEYDADGLVTNIVDVQEALWAKREALLDSFGGEMDEAEQEQLDAFDEYMENFTSAYDEYENHRQTQMDTEAERLAKQLEAQQVMFDDLNKTLEENVSLIEKDLELVEYYLSKVEDDFFGMAEAAALMVGSLSSANPGKGGQLGGYLDILAEQERYKKELDEKYASGEINQAQYIEGLMDCQSAIIEQLQNINELDKTMKGYYGETLEAAQEELSQYTDMMEHHTEVLEHYSNLLELIGASKDWERMKTVLEAQVSVAENAAAVSKANYEMLAQEAADKKAAWDALGKGLGDELTYEESVIKQQWLDAQAAADEAQNQMLEDAEAWAESLKSLLETELAELADILNESLSGEFGSLDNMMTAMERANSLQEEYLTTTNQVYETNKLMHTAQQEIDKTTNSVAKRRLKQYIDETEQLQNKNKLSQFELDIQKAKYDLLVAEIALEEAQQAKSTVRLQRDSEGNFGYVYTADQSAIADAEQQLADAQNALYNIGLEGANKYAESYAQTIQEMNDAVTELTEQWQNGEIGSKEEYQQRMLELEEYYGEKLMQYSELHSIALQTDSRVAADAWTKDFAHMTTQTQKWMQNVDVYVQGVEASMDRYQQGIDRVEEYAGLDLDSLKTKTQNIKDENKALAKSITEKDGLLDAMKAEIEQVGKLTGEYAKLRTEIQGTVDDYEALLRRMGVDIDTAAAGNPPFSGGDTEDPNTGGNDPGTTDPGTTDPGTTDPGDTGTKTISVGGKVNASGAQIYDYAGDTSGEHQYFSSDPVYKVLKESGDWIQVRHHKLSSGITGWFKKSDVTAMNTGGYTGDWAGSYGKLAFLHQKELVLNAKDTENLLASMDILDKIISTIDLYSSSAQLGGLLSIPRYGGFDNEPLEQNVHIEASFPGVSDHNEIEEALNNLINRASQYAHRR